MKIRDQIIARAAELGLTAHAIARQPGIGIGRTTLHRYFSGNSDLTGEKIERLLAVLGLEIRAKMISGNISGNIS